MRKVLRGVVVVAINLIVLVALLVSVELYFRSKYPTSTAYYTTTNGIWQKFAPYVMFLTAPGTYPEWQNGFTGKVYQSRITTNSLGFNDPHEFDYTKPYQRAANERVVLFTGGSVAWGVGATATAATIAGRMQYYLNSAQDKIKYTVINMGMGSYIAFQQYIALTLWGEEFDPDWVVSMDGYNDASVGCGYSQGVGNPMYYAIAQAYISSYLFNTPKPVFYRGWFENELIKHSAAYRVLTGKAYVPESLTFDDSSNEDNTSRRAIVPTKLGQSRDILAFYLKAEKSILDLFPKAHYILSTQPTVNQFSGDFVDIYQAPAGSAAHAEAMAKRQAALETYLTYYQDKACTAATSVPSYTYILVDGAIELERMVDQARQGGRDVAYYNIGTLFPDGRPERIPNFIDPAHLSDQGDDTIGHFYAEKILAADGGNPPTRPPQ